MVVAPPEIRCNACGENLPATAEFFYPRSDRPAGKRSKWRSFCRICDGVRASIWCRTKSTDMKAYGAKHRAQNREELRRKARIAAVPYRAKNREKMAQDNHARYLANPEKYRWYEIKRRYGVTQAEYERLLLSQHGVCAVCQNPETARGRNGEMSPYLRIDHNRDSGRVRGLLCSRCNSMLGFAREDTGCLHKAIEYLEHYNVKV